MSSPFAINDLLQVTYVCEGVAQAILSVLHYRVSSLSAAGPDGETDADNLALKLSLPATNPLLTAMKAAAASNFFFHSVKVQRIKPVRSIYLEQLITDFGTQAQTLGPINTAVSIEKQSTHVGSGGVGRLQWGGQPKDVVGSNLDSAYVAAFMVPIASAITAGISVVTGGSNYSITPCLPKGGADHSFDIFHAVVREHTRTMHRRTVGLGI